MAPVRTALRRIMRDVTVACETNATTLAESGIYYHSDEANVTHGTALIIGPKDTPYWGGYYFFDIQFPDDYPFSPLKIKTLTQDGITRFNPNMYIEGKVCLSILNTWHDGPQWSGVQSLESVLMVILSDVLHGNPIINEPAYRGYALDHPDAVIYNRILWHANLHTAIHTQMNRPPSWAEPFLETMNTTFQNKREALLAAAEASIVYDGMTEVSRVYRMTTKYNFRSAVEKLKSIKS